MISSLKSISRYLLVALFLEYLSFVAFFLPTLRWPVLILAVVVLAIIAWRNFPLALSLAWLELILGGKGYLLFVPLGEGRLGLRLAWFLTLFVVWLVKLNQEGWHRSWVRWRLEWQENLLWRLTAVALLIVAFGLVSGYLTGNPPNSIFLDANGFLYLGLAAILADRLPAGDRSQWLKEFKTVLIAGLTVVLLENLTILYVFSHHLSGWTGGLYRWARETGVGEITRVTNSFYRVFFQSQLYAVAGYLLAQVAILRRWPSGSLLGRIKANFIDWYLAAISLLVIVLSLSRSFWFGTAVGLGILAVFGWRRWSLNWRHWLQYLGVILVSLLAVIGFLYAFTEFNNPYAVPGSPITDRFVLDEAAGASRRNLLLPLWQRVKQNWLLGAGFGTTVTYQTKDPRILEKNPSGWYTTYSFEWGHLDLWLKFGLVGYLLFLGLVLFSAWRLWRSANDLAAGWGLVLLALTAIHVFTPYLNHPLGLGLLLLAWLGLSQPLLKETVL